MKSESKHDYKSYKNRYETRGKIIYVFALVLLAVSVALGYFLSGKSLYAAGVILAADLLFVLLVYITKRNDDYYISNIIADLSDMLDCLMELSNEEIFPDNEDSLLSKLQSQVLGLVHILKMQREHESIEHENIKALVSDLSHQLKTPVATLKMYTDFLKQDDISKDERAEYVKVLDQAVERLLFLSEGMIKLSRLESGLIHVEKKKQSINDTVLSAIKDSFMRAQNAGIEIRYTEEYKGNVNHDRKWTEEAVFNLIDNAVKYGTAGNVIYVAVRSLGSSVEISVEDENTAIDPREYNSLFKRFFRGANSKNTEGAGIGLYLTVDIIEKQGGLVSVKQGKTGNRFNIVLFID